MARFYRYDVIVSPWPYDHTFCGSKSIPRRFLTPPGRCESFSLFPLCVYSSNKSRLQNVFFFSLAYSLTVDGRFAEAVFTLLSHPLIPRPPRGGSCKKGCMLCGCGETSLLRHQLYPYTWPLAEADEAERCSMTSNELFKLP